MGDLNMESSDSSLKEFLENKYLTNLIKSKSCFKDKCSCIDLILTNRRYSFNFTGSYETDISDLNHMMLKYIQC